MKQILKILIFICLIFFLFIIYIKKDDIPISLFQIQSGSMAPEITVGEVVMIIKQNKYKKDDVITYKVSNMYFITHRIKEVSDNGYVTKGDFNNVPDAGIVKDEQIKGKVILHSKLLGKLFEYRYYLIIVLSLLLILIFFIK